MRIIFLNCWYGQVGENFFNFLQRESAKTEFFCLQEVDPTLFAKLSPILPDFKGEYVTDGRMGPVGHIFGQAIFMRNNFQVKQVEKIDLYRDAARDAGSLQFAEVQLGGEIISLGNLHGKAHPAHKLDTPFRVRQSKKILDFFAKKKGSKIIGGDFNLLPETKSIKMFEEGGYRNLIADFKVKTTRNRLTWEQAERQAREEGRKFFGRQYFADYVFTSPEVKVKDFSVPNIEISDHLPLILDFEL